MAVAGLIMQAGSAGKMMEGIDTVAAEIVTGQTAKDTVIEAVMGRNHPPVAIETTMGAATEPVHLLEA